MRKLPTVPWSGSVPSLETIWQRYLKRLLQKWHLLIFNIKPLFKFVEERVWDDLNDLWMKMNKKLYHRHKQMHKTILNRIILNPSIVERYTLKKIGSSPNYISFVLLCRTIFGFSRKKIVSHFFHWIFLSSAELKCFASFARNPPPVP